MSDLKRLLVFNVDGKKKELEFDLDLKTGKAVVDFNDLQNLLDKISMYPFEYKVISVSK